MPPRATQPSPLRWEVLLEIPFQELHQVPRRTTALADAVCAVGIVHHRELLVGRDERVDERFRILVVHVVVAGAVDE